MEPHDEDLAKSLVDEDQDLRTAYEEHNRLKARVDKLAGRAHLSPGEEVEKKNFQKLKLAEKTKIMKILDDYRKSQRVESPA